MTMNAEKHTRAIHRLLREFSEVSQANEPLAKHATYRVGGPADVFVLPEKVEELEQIIRMCLKQNIPYFILGEGANVLIHDRGFRGVVISLKKCCDQLFHKENLLYVGSGVAVQHLVAYCEEHGLEGLDFMSGIPGTVGGALKMNAGAFVGEIGDRVIRVDAIDGSGKRIQISQEAAGFGYRRADGLEGKVLLGCWIWVDWEEPESLAAKRQEYLTRRAEKQPLEYPSCGSVFKRPPGDYAGRLVEAAGCKGLKIGRAMVSPKHANFIVNLGGATANDIYSLISEVQNRVYKQFKVWLELEVKLVGFSPQEVNRVKGPVADEQNKT